MEVSKVTRLKAQEFLAFGKAWSSEVAPHSELGAMTVASWLNEYKRVWTEAHPSTKSTLLKTTADRIPSVGRPTAGYIRKLAARAADCTPLQVSGFVLPLSSS